MTETAPPPSEQDQALLAQLQHICGPAHVLTADAHDLLPWEQDWRKHQRGRALAVVRPSNTAEVSGVVKACAQARIALVPQGGNTGMVVGSTPDDSGRQVVLSLTRMNRVRALDTDNLTITVEAGCILQNLQTAADEAGLLFPLRLASEGSCTIGGNLATNAGGTQVVRFGNTRDLCLGLEVVTAEGQVWQNLTGLRKDNTGYDLRHLMIGSEGTLGVITAATMKLFPKPAVQLTALAALPDLQAAVQLLGLAHGGLGAGLTGFEVMSAQALDLVAKHHPQLNQPLRGQAPWYVLLENNDGESEQHARSQFEALLEQALAQNCILDAVVAENIAQAKALWHIRESIPLAQATEGLNIKHDISLPISRIPAFVAHMDAVLEREFPGARIINYGHLGDGNLHYNVQAPEGLDAGAFLREQSDAVGALVYAAVLHMGGSISAEHGVGTLKADKLPHYKDPVALASMRSIKAALDPHNILNPGKLFST
jgi:FAD/FMN-containing dehydrogenase